jgi:hypothetical protein
VNGGRETFFSGARVGSTRSTAPARTAGLDFNLPVHALRIGTIRVPGENDRAGRGGRESPLQRQRR